MFQLGNLDVLFPTRDQELGLRNFLKDEGCSANKGGMSFDRIETAQNTDTVGRSLRRLGVSVCRGTGEPRQHGFVLDPGMRAGFYKLAQNVLRRRNKTRGPAPKNSAGP